jgi:uncharacterized membrane protein YoaK (UPF0700 family)
MRRVVLRGLRDAAGALGRAVAGDDYAHDVRAGWAPPSKPARRTLPLIVVVLTFTTGVVDAVSYLGLGRVFTGLQTGNVVVLGFALAGTEGFSVAPPAVSLASFFVGAWLGGRLAAHLNRRHRRWFALALSIEALLVAAAAAAAAGLPTDVATARRLLVIALLAAGMGLRSATVRRLAVPEVTTTVVTSTITALAADSAVPGAGFTRRLWQLVTIAMRLVGAVAGALLVGVSLFVPFLLVASLIAVAAGAYLAPVVVRERRRSSGSPGPPASGL